MNFTTLMDVAAAKQNSKDKIKINRYSLDLPAPKKEAKEVSRSEVVKKLIQEKENEKKMKEKVHREKEKANEIEEKKKSQFRIPKKKPVEVQTPADKEKLINSLFEDDDDDISEPVSNGVDVSSRLSPSDETSKSSSHSKSDNHKHSSTSSKSSSSSSKDKERSSHSSSRDSKSGSSSNHSGDRKSHSSSSSHSNSSSSSSHPKSSSSLSHSKSSSSSSSHSKSSSSHSKSSSSSNSKSSSSSSKHGTKPSSTSSESQRSSSSSSKHKSSSGKSSSSSSKLSISTSSTSSSDLKSPSSTSPSAADQQPIALSKHHLKPVAERHATVPSAQLSEKEKILAKLAAIKQRTLDAIHKEQQGKGRRSRGEKSQFSSRSSKAEKDDERVKSKEIVRDVYSSDEEGQNMDGMPSVVDMMLSEHNLKLERDKITRLAKQAWDRATKKDNGEDPVSEKKKRHSSKKSRFSSSASKSVRHSSDRKRREHSLSPEPDSFRKKARPSDVAERKKPKIVRHAGNAAPPPPDFKAILAMAAQKVKDPPKPTGGLGKIPKKKKKEEEERPLTQEEKERKERVKSKEYQQWLKFGGKHPNNGKESSNSSTDEEDNRKDKKVVSHNRDKIDSNKKPPSSVVRPNKEITVNENVLVCGPAEDGDDYDSDGDVGQHKHKQQKTQESVNPFDRIYSSVHKKKPANQLAAQKRRFVDEEEESEESDLDGFIDDGDDGDRDYSKHIAKIFNYNKNRYADEDDDVSDMEANFATVMAEEKRSAKLGLMEDLEDMKREEEELKRKALLKKKMRR